MRECLPLRRSGKIFISQKTNCLTYNSICLWGYSFEDYESGPEVVETLADPGFIFI